MGCALLSLKCPLLPALLSLPATQSQPRPLRNQHKGPATPQETLDIPDMETISNIASSASKLIYGDPKAESGQEPISGQSGRGTIDEPYDSGNLEGKGVDLFLCCPFTSRLTPPHGSFLRRRLSAGLAGQPSAGSTSAASWTNRFSLFDLDDGIYNTVFFLPRLVSSKGTLLSISISFSSLTRRSAITQAYIQY